MSDKRSWIVKMVCTVTKEVICDNCTKKEVEENPWDHAIQEDELDQVDWDILSIEPNT